MLRSIWVVFAIAVLVVAAPRASDAQPPATCKAMCQRLTDCKMPSYTKMCLDSCKQYGYEATKEGRAQLLTLTRYSCKQIQSMVGTDARQPQRSSTRIPSVRNSERSVSNDEMDQLDNEELDDGEMQPGGAAPARDAPIRANSRSPAARSSSDSGDNCAPVCDRFAQCRLWKHESCMSFCSSNTSDPAKNLSAAQWSCPKLGAWMQQLGVSSNGSRHGNAGNAGGGSRAWTCGAEASFGSALGNGPMIYQVLAGVGYGANRQEASAAAINDCESMVTAAMSIHGDERQEGGECGISRCNPSNQ